jgi:hypothetical protein
LEVSKKQIVELTQSLEATKIDLEKQRKLNEESKQECSISISAEKDSIAGKLSEDTTKLLSLQNENKALQDQLKSLESSIQALTKNTTECETAKTGLQSQLTALQSQLQNLEQEKQKEHTAMETLQGVENQEKQKLESLEKDNLRMKTELQELTAMKESSATNLKQLEQQLADSRQKANDVETLKGTMQKEREQLNKERDDAIAKLEESYAKVIQLEKDKSIAVEGEKNEAIKKMNEAIEELDSARQNAESKCSQSETERINKLTEEIKTLGEQEQKHLQDVMNCEQKYQDELKVKQELEKAMAQAKDDLKAKDAQVTIVQNQVVALSEEMKKKDELISQLQVSTEGVKKELETAKALDVKRVAFEEDNKKLLVEIEKERQEKKQLQEDKEQMVAQLQGELVKQKQEQARKDQEAKEKAEQEAKDKADREAKEKAEQARIQEANEKADREAKERAGQALIQEAKEKDAKERADQARIQEEKEKTDREARMKEEQEAKLKSDKVENEKAKEKEVVDVEKAKEIAKLKEQEKFPAGIRRNAFKINTATNIISFGKNDKDGVGETDVPLIELKSALHRVKEAFNICKTDLLIKYVTLMSYPDFFRKYIKTLDKSMEEVKKFDAFFVRKVAYPAVIDNFKEFMDRDSFIYRNISETKSDVIFVYQLIKQLDNNTIDKYIDSDLETADMIALINDVIMKPDSNLNQIIRIYNDLKSNVSGLNIIYSELIADKKRISTFIKYRRDTGNSNPRYNIEISKNNLLMLEYTNIDGTVGFESGAYNRKSAVTSLKDKPKETYLLGEFDGIYTSEDAKTIAHSTQVSYLVDRMVDKEDDLCMIGYGQSGSGKTSTLIYLSVGQIDGILIELCKLKKFIGTVSKITVNLKNMYTYHWLDRKNYNEYGDFEYKVGPIGEETSFTYVVDVNDAKSNWRNDDGIALAKFINDSFDKREVESTPNNPNSSRSHVICCLTCNRKDYKIDESGNPTEAHKDPRRIIICDLAGVENKFQISMDEVINFDLRYAESDKYGVGKEGSKDIIFDKYFCEQENVRDPKEDGGGYDSDSTVSSYSSSSSATSTESDLSSVSSVSSYSSSSSSDNEDDDGTHYESQNTYKSDWMLYRNLLDEEEEDGKLFNDKEYGLTKYPYGKYNDESASKIQVHIDDMKIKDNLFIENTEEPLTSGHCLPRYSFNTVCNKQLEWKGGWKGNTIDATIKNLETAFNECIPKVRYHRNLYHMYLKFLKLELSKPTKPSEEEIGKIKTAKSAETLKYIDPTGNNVWDKSNLIPGKHTMISVADSKGKASKLSFANMSEYISYSDKMDSPVLYLACQIEIWKEIKIESGGKVKIGGNFREFFPKLQTIVMQGKSLHDDVKSATNGRVNEMTIEDFLKNRYELAKREFEEIFCTKHRFNKLLFNMQLRINEGMMINHSLGKLREDIKSIMMNSISIKDGDKTYLPIMYDNPISPAIRNTYIEDEYYDNFVSSSTGERPIKGKIMEIIGGKKEDDNLGLDIKKMYMAVFTVINITDSDRKLINNPPNPPYINISKLIYNLPLEQRGMNANVDIEKILEIYKTLLDQTSNYSFYKKNPDFIALQTNYTNLKGADYKATIYEANIKKYIDLIQGNNPSTLIGSLEGTEMIKNTTFDKMIAYFDEDLNKSIFKKYESIGLEYYNFDSKQSLEPPVKKMDSRAIISTLKK